MNIDLIEELAENIKGIDTLTEWQRAKIAIAADLMLNLADELKECQDQRRAAFRRIEELDRELDAMRAQIGQGEPDVRNLLARFEHQCHRMGVLWERCQGKCWPEFESDEFTRLRDELVPETKAQLLALATPAPKAAEKKPFTPDWADYRQGFQDGQASAPQQKPLTDEQIVDVARACYIDVTQDNQDSVCAFARAIESAHNIGEKK